MKTIFFIFMFFLFFGCSVKKTSMAGYEGTQIYKSSLEIDEDWKEVQELFVKNCQTSKGRRLYGRLCDDVLDAKESADFFKTNFSLFRLVDTKKGEVGLLSGYYEPELHGSLKKQYPYIYPVYATPEDLLDIKLGDIYPELKHYRLRGRMVDHSIVPYYARGEKSELKAKALCYVDDPIELFFLEIQGSGRVRLSNGDVLFLGYANQNGHKYSSIGKYMVQKGYLKRGEVSLWSIAEFLHNNPDKQDEILNSNKSMVFFQKKTGAATGSLGIRLYPYRSVAVDPRRVPLGAMLYYETDTKQHSSGVVFAQDTGGAIKGSVRLDLFCGYSQEGKQLAGELKNKLKVWIYLPKKGGNE